MSTPTDTTTSTSATHMRMTFARRVISEGDFGLSSLMLKALSMPWEVSDALDEYAWTDFKTLYFNVAKLNSRLDTKALKDRGYIGAVCHELLHNLFRHNTRAEGKDRQKWITACEWAINRYLIQYLPLDWIEALGVMYPPEKAQDWMYHNNRHHTTDDYYAFLLEHPDMAPPVEEVPCTYCSRPNTENEAVPASEDVVPEAEYREILKHMVGDMAKASQVPWDILLFGGIEDAVEMEYSWTTPNKISEYLPGMRPEKLMSFVWVLDVSPSVSKEMIEAFLAVLQTGIDKYRDAQHRIILFAECVLKDITVDAGFDVSTLEIETGWGTCLREVWQILETDLPDYALVLTDLELEAVPAPSHTQIVWGVVGGYPAFTPDYGTIINLPS